MYSYRHLKDFLEQTTQKAFWVFTYAHMAGLVAGFILARALSGLLPWLPGIILLPACLIAGLVLTWGHQGEPLYLVVLRWAGFQLRRLTPARLEVHAGRYYTRRAPATRSFTISGALSYRGEDADPRVLSAPPGERTRA